jgi:hypothetical protein
MLKGLNRNKDTTKKPGDCRGDCKKVFIYVILYYSGLVVF